MIRLSTLFWLVAVSTAGFAMFAAKYQVQELADQLTRTVKQADDTERDIRALDAEWAYLNRPDALAQMNQRLLSLVPIATKQLRANLADVAMRPAPPPPPAPVETVAAEPPFTVAAASDPEAPPADADMPAASPLESATPPPSPSAQARPTENARPIVTVALNTHVAAQPLKPIPAKPAARWNLPRHAASLDELIAQIAETR
jgi:hypothetical protein